MAVLDKIKFWKKDDVDSLDTGLDSGKGFDMGFPSEEGKTKGQYGDNFGFGSYDELDAGTSNSGTPQKAMGPSPEIGGTDDNLDIKGPNFGREVPPEIPDQQRVSRTTLQQSTPETSGYSVHDDVMLKNIELVSSKIDALRAHIESLNQKVNNIEKSLERMEMHKGRTW